VAFSSFTPAVEYNFVALFSDMYGTTSQSQSQKASNSIRPSACLRLSTCIPVTTLWELSNGTLAP